MKHKREPTAADLAVTAATAYRGQPAPAGDVVAVWRHRTQPGTYAVEFRDGWLLGVEVRDDGKPWEPDIGAEVMEEFRAEGNRDRLAEHYERMDR
jgi:hypothetical protein